MENAEVKNTTVDIEAGDCLFKSGVSKITFDGYLKIYNESDEEEIKTKNNIVTKYDANNNIVYSTNLYDTESENTSVYATSSEKIKSYTGSKKAFLGKGGLTKPEGIKKINLNRENGLGKEACNRS